MQTAPSMHLNWLRLSNDPGHFTFGYYDRFALDSSNCQHLALNIPHQEHLPQAGETAEVGVIDLETQRFRRLAETRTWCHQQGCMSLWLPQRTGTFIFNDFDDERQRVVARIFDVEEGEIGVLDGGIYALSRDGRYGATLNYGRIPRRGYSYALTPLPVDRPWPDLDEDGLFLTEIETGDVRLIASYRQLMGVHPHPWDLDDQMIWLNHTIFNCDSTRVMVLFRHRSTAEEAGWKTHMITMNLDGSDITASLSDLYWRNGGISHQIWGRFPREILVDANWCLRGHEYVVFDESGWPMQAQRLSPGMGTAGHLNFSPDGEWLVADTYPDGERMQRLALVRVKTGQCKLLGSFQHKSVPGLTDLRCDLHPRWSRDGSLLTIDTIHEGERNIYLLQMAEAFDRFEELPDA